ncbi:hypothetical protein E3U55_14380 [Filobacillus milosensis]|uniref:Tyr recombinase domain-containing protein n=1 Tax=Filobacillus milosensis TaxID=94137 RepID=A0A4Y8IGE1_9BACI|nr:tyrosine-type recombinase/integrase [Filobacillus milosensis]TFB14101.1 hypothetical protein E3U55_14380 [Filobacillus milosensis]
MTIERESKTKKISEGIESLIFEYGLDNVQSIIEQKITLSEKKEENPKNELSLADGKTIYLKSDTFFMLKETSQKTYQSDLNHFLENAKTRLKKKSISTISILDVFAPRYLKEYVGQFNNSYTKARKCAFLRSFLQTVYPEYYEEKKAHLKRALKVSFKKSSAPKAFSKIQLAELIALSKLGPNGMRNHAILWVLFGSGIRISSLIHLKIGDINFKKQSLRIIAKGYDEDEEIIAKINKLALMILKEYLDFTYEYAQFDMPKEEYNNLYVFSKDGGVSPLSARAVQIVVKNLVLKAKSIPEYIKKEKRSKKRGSNHFGPHSIRHSFAVYALESGVDIYTISRLLNHASLSSTEKYLDLLDHQLKSAIENHPFANKEFIKLQNTVNK